MNIPDTLPSEPHKLLSQDNCIVVCHQAAEEWLTRRKERIGASEIWRAMTSPLSLYAEKIGAVEPEDISNLQRIKWGKRLEAVIGKGYSEDTGRECEPYGFLLQSIKHPWAAATPDWEMLHKELFFWPLEIKNVGTFMGGKWVDGPPDNIMAQVQMQMLVTGAPKATVVGLLGGNELMWLDIPRDEVWINKIIYAGEKLWNCIQTKTPPEADGSEATTKAINALFPQDTGEQITLDPALEETASILAQLQVADKATKEAIEDCKNKIKLAMGEATVGLFASGGGFSWKLQEKNEYLVKASKTRVLRPIKVKE